MTKDNTKSLQSSIRLCLIQELLKNFTSKEEKFSTARLFVANSICLHSISHFKVK